MHSEKNAGVPVFHDALTTNLDHPFLPVRPLIAVCPKTAAICFPKGQLMKSPNAGYNIKKHHPDMILFRIETI
jgi:hypothetical protein